VSIRANLAALLAGALFGVGLVVGGMTQPSKVVAFLDFFGSWDPSLAFVMGGAIAVYLPAYLVITRRNTPMFAARFAFAKKTGVDWRLLTGAALFGAGWGLAGFCPGPALTSLGALAPAALVFTAAMIAGFALHRGVEILTRRSEPDESGSPEPATDP